MWYVFPQVARLGKSRMSRRYAIKSRDEAEAYFSHNILAPRLRECTEIANDIEGKSAYDIFGSLGHKKLRSSMTLLNAVADDPSPFRTAVKKYYDQSDLCEHTLEFISQ